MYIYYVYTLLLVYEQMEYIKCSVVEHFIFSLAIGK